MNDFLVRIYQGDMASSKMGIFQRFKGFGAQISPYLSGRGLKNADFYRISLGER